MSNITYTPNLNLIIEAEYTQAAKSNLYKIDRMAARFQTGSGGNETISASAILTLSGETIRIGDPSSLPSSISVNGPIDFSNAAVSGFSVKYTDLDFTGGSLTSISDYSAVINANSHVSSGYEHSQITSANPHGTTAAQVGAYTYAEVNALITPLATTSALLAHTGAVNNPHSVSAAQVGAYTSAQVDALLGPKADASALSSHTGNKSNPHNVTAAQVGTYTTSQIDTYLLAKADLSILSAHLIDTSNPHIVTAVQIGTYTSDEIDAMLINISDANIPGTISGTKISANFGAQNVSLAGDIILLDSGYEFRLRAPQSGTTAGYVLELPETTSGMEGKFLTLLDEDTGKLGFTSPAAVVGFTGIVHILTGPEIAAGIFTLPDTPTLPEQTFAIISGAPGQINGIDFSVSGNQFNFGPIRNLLESGLAVQVYYK